MWGGEVGKVVWRVVRMEWIRERRGGGRVEGGGEIVVGLGEGVVGGEALVDEGSGSFVEVGSGGRGSGRGIEGIGKSLWMIF